MSTGTQNQIYSNPNFRPLHVRDAVLYERGNVAAFAHEGSEAGVATVAGANSNPGAHPNVPFVVGVLTAFGAQYIPGNIRPIDSEILFNHPHAPDERLGGNGGVQIQTNPFPLASQGGTPTNTAPASIAAVRGAITIGGIYISVNNTPSDPTVTVATTITQGYLYGVQGKFIIRGTLATVSGEYSAALQGQLDLSAAVAVTSPLSALWLDMGASASAAIIAAPTHINAINITNSTTAHIHSVLSYSGPATYAIDLTDIPGGTFFVAGASGGSNTANLVVLINGTAYKIQLFA